MNDPKKIICCGNAAFDLIAQKSAKRGDLAFYATPGGSVLNTAVQLARLGLRVSFMAKTGTDFLADSLEGTMKREGISAKYVVRDKAIMTGLALARIDPEGNSSYLFYKSEGPALCFKKSDIPSAAFKGAGVFHTGSAYSYDENSWKDAHALAVRAKSAGACVSYDPNWRASRVKNISAARSRAMKLAKLAGILKLSDSDAEGITGAKTLGAALKKIGRDAYVTLGAAGSFYWDGKRKIYHPAFRVKVADTIGAGDAYTAGLIYRYSVSGKDRFRDEIMKNLRFATAVSAIVCTAKGATAGLKNLKQVEKFLSALKYSR